MPYHVVYAIAIAFLLFGMVGALILSRRNAGRAFRFKAALQSLVDHEVPLCAQHYLLAKVALAKDATDALAWLEVEYAAALKREAPQTVPAARPPCL